MYKENKGFLYEKIAQKYLVDRNYIVLETNFLCKFGEIDLICMYKNVLVFVEVKGRKDSSYGFPREYITDIKKKKIISTAKFYILTRGLYNIQCRFDVVEIIKNIKTINHIENAFE